MPVIAAVAVAAAALTIIWSIFGVRYRSIRVRQAKTFIEITARTDKSTFEKLTRAVTNEIIRLNTVVNVYVPTSELSELNHRILNGSKRIQLSEEMTALLSEGLYYSKETDGRYDITIRPVMMLWGFGTDKKRVPAPYEIQNTLARTGSRMVRIQGKTLLAARPVMFDLGSYGKGYALTLFAGHASRLKVRHYLINFGGNIIARGKNPKNKYWTVGIQDPRSDRMYATVSLSNESISTSGDYENFFFAGSNRYHHIMDATTGYPSRAAIAATVIGSDATATDALSTIAVIMGTNFFAKSFNYRAAWIFTDVSNAITVYSRTNLVIRKRE